MCLKFQGASHAPTDACGPTHTPRPFLQFLARSDDGTARRTQASKFASSGLHIVQHLVTCTSIQSLRQCPIANVRFRPKGFRPAEMVEHGAHGTGEYPNCSFCYAIRRRVVRDWGCSLIHLARRCRASCPSIIRVHYLPDPFLRLILCYHPERFEHLIRLPT